MPFSSIVHFFHQFKKYVNAYSSFLWLLDSLYQQRNFKNHETYTLFLAVVGDLFTYFLNFYEVTYESFRISVTRKVPLVKTAISPKLFDL